MKLHVALLALLLPFAPACSSAFESEALGVTWTPPKAFKLDRQESGPPAVAFFSPGLELRRATLKLPAPTELNVGALLEQTRAAAGIQAGAALVSARAGSIPAGAVARYELKDGSERLLVYVLPKGDSALTLTLRADEGRFSQLQNSLERSLSTLKVR